MTAGEKVSSWQSGNEGPAKNIIVEEDSDVIGSISSSEEHGMYIN